nr:hypothetical protein HK105_005905 [Polyrhizophydium stewartii]
MPVLAIPYKTQYEQLKQRCALLEEESALLRRERSYKQNQLDAARETLSKSTSELAEVEGLIAHYQNKLKELHATIATSREQAAKLGDIVAKLDERETLASTTLDALVRRRDKVKVVFEGIQRSLIDATPERVSSLDKHFFEERLYRVSARHNMLSSASLRAIEAATELGDNQFVHSLPRFANDANKALSQKARAAAA